MRRRILVGISFVVVGSCVIAFWDRITVRESGQGYSVSGHSIVATYGYSNGGDKLRYAIFRTWKNGTTPDEMLVDTRMQRDFLGWPTIRLPDGRMTPVSTDGNVYFFDGNNLKTITVEMDEHTDTLRFGSATSVDEFWQRVTEFAR